MTVRSVSSSGPTTSQADPDLSGQHRPQLPGAAPRHRLAPADRRLFGRDPCRLETGRGRHHHLGGERRRGEDQVPEGLHREEAVFPGDAAAGPVERLETEGFWLLSGSGRVRPKPDNAIRQEPKATRISELPLILEHRNQLTQHHRGRAPDLVAVEIEVGVFDGDAFGIRVACRIREASRRSSSDTSSTFATSPGAATNAGRMSVTPTIGCSVKPLTITCTGVSPPALAPHRDRRRFLPPPRVTPHPPASRRDRLHRPAD